MTHSKIKWNIYGIRSNKYNQKKFYFRKKFILHTEQNMFIYIQQGYI